MRVNPCSEAYRINSARLCGPSLRMMFWRWFRMLFGFRRIRVAISSSPRPPAMCLASLGMRYLSLFIFLRVYVNDIPFAA